MAEAVERLKGWARALKRDVVALWLAARDPRTPLAAKLVAGAVAAYALSPIDLIPDFIPVLGYLDDLLLVPAGIWLAVRLIPEELLAELRAVAAARDDDEIGAGCSRRRGKPQRETVLAALKHWSAVLKRDVAAILGAARDPRTPWYAKALALAVAAYALSPIDLIPDFIPVLGLLDDLIIVPLGIALALRLIPADVMAEHRARTAAAPGSAGFAAAAVMVAIWLGIIALAAWLAYRHLSRA